MAFKQMLRRNTKPAKVFDADDDSTYSTAKALPSKTPIANPAAQEKESNFGTSAVTKIFYKHHKKGWVETPPKQTSNKNVKMYDRVAIKIYKSPDPKKPIVNGRSALKIESVEIQSPILVAALKSILEPLGVFLGPHETAVFREPFKPLYFAYDNIVDLYDRTYSDTILKEHLHLLTQLMNELFGDTMTRLQHLRESKLICYDLAWTYFPKGSIVYSGAKDCERLYRVDDTEYDDSNGRMKISCQKIAFDGTKFAWKAARLEISAFSDNVPVASLSNYPLAFYKNPDLLKARLIVRGKLVLEYQELKYREYSGTGHHGDLETKRHNVRNRSSSSQV